MLKQKMMISTVLGHLFSLQLSLDQTVIQRSSTYYSRITVRSTSSTIRVALPCTMHRNWVKMIPSKCFSSTKLTPISKKQEQRRQHFTQLSRMANSTLFKSFGTTVSLARHRINLTLPGGIAKDKQCYITLRSLKVMQRFISNFSSRSAELTSLLRIVKASVQENTHRRSIDSNTIEQ